MNHVSILNLPILTKSLYFKPNLKMLSILGFILIVFLLGIYIFQVSSLISETYILQNYQKIVAQILEENKILEIDFAKTNSLSNITPKIEELGFEKINAVNYIQVVDNSVARKP